ncbi:amidinotransferase [Frankia sp. R43]|uniref:dimethylargininase n=1 Tax=Frankia sp. R43 TaxID=269536 RepID=UPI0006CA5BA0|nr:dimethylargininase [Frankia sp. R43]KPM57034.1 amidinotransferase [Frankia sp. R43]
MQRTATGRHYLMVEPTYFDVEYSINPWMHPELPTYPKVALEQWTTLRDLYLELGHRVDVLEPRPGLPDMVFSANGATVVDGRVLVARFRHPQRRPESDVFRGWFTDHGFSVVRQAQWTNEGEGDCLTAGARILAGSGFRTTPEAHTEIQEFLGLPTVTLTLTDPRYYHLDTALAVLDDDLIMYNPQAFSADSVRRLQELYPDAITASTDDAEAFGLNAVSDGRHVVLPHGATGVIAQLRDRGFEPIGVDISELQKAGGGPKCCTLELRGGD